MNDKREMCTCRMIGRLEWGSQSDGRRRAVLLLLFWIILWGSKGNREDWECDVNGGEEREGRGGRNRREREKERRLVEIDGRKGERRGRVRERQVWEEEMWRGW